MSPQPVQVVQVLSTEAKNASDDGDGDGAGDGDVSAVSPAVPLVLMSAPVVVASGGDGSISAAAAESDASGAAVNGFVAIPVSVAPESIDQDVEAINTQPQPAAAALYTITTAEPENQGFNGNPFA